MPLTTLRTVLILVLALPCSGCFAIIAAGAATVGAVKYQRNAVHQDFLDDFDSTWRAALAALRDLGYPVDLDHRHGPTEGEIEVLDVKVNVGRYPGGHTRVEVRAGTFESEDNLRRAELILERVGELLR